MGFKKDREQRQTTMSLYLNIFLIWLRKSVKNIVFFGVILSVTYWLGFLVFSFSPTISLKLTIWGIYSDEARKAAAVGALALLIAATALYLNRLHTLGRFVETYGESSAFDGLGERDYQSLAKLIDAEELLILEREKLIDQATAKPVEMVVE
jgi:ABC-type multidrug transport system fused ATPase/permease subunit